MTFGRIWANGEDKGSGFALATPHSVDSISTSGNQEDYVSMGMSGARRLERMLHNLRHILAIELLAACQGIDLRAPLKTSPRLAAVHSALRLKVPFAASDRLLALDIEEAAATVRRAEVQSQVNALLPSYR